MRNLFLALLLFIGLSAQAQQSPVEKYGQLSVKGTALVSENGDTVQLRGMSLFWSQWMGQFYNADLAKWLRDDWKCNVIRVAMGVEKGGYLTDPDGEKKKVETVVDACIDLGLYVIIDYHAHEAHENTAAAKKFFSEMSKKYGKYPNVIYETYNEPLQYIGWDTILKPYHEDVLKSIRANDPDNIVICGTRMWTQRVDEAAANPIEDKNVMYALHYYAYSHRRPLREIAQKAIDMGAPLFVSEFGNCHASGAGKLDSVQAKVWWDFLDKNKISWCNWSVADKDETASIIKPGSSATGGWKEEDLTPSGVLVRDEIRAKNK